MTKNRIDRLASKIWYQAVEHGLGLNSPIAVELRLEGDRVKADADGIKRPRKWKHFRDGKRTPEDIPGLLNVFDIAEREVPGTARWFRSPIWQALKGGFAHHLEVERQMMIVPSIHALLWPVEEHLHFDDFEGIELPPLKTFRHDNIALCEQLESIELVEAVILILELGQITQAGAVTRRALGLYSAALPKLVQIPQFVGNFPDLLDAIEGRYVSALYQDWQEDFQPWFVQLPNVADPRYDIEAAVAELQSQK